MDAFLSLASLLPSEQPELPQDEEKNGGNSTTVYCVIA